MAFFSKRRGAATDDARRECRRRTYGRTHARPRRCTNKVDAPKYVMELVGGPVCMACGQKIVMQEFRGKSPMPIEPEFEQPTHEDIVNTKAAGLKLPAWAEEALVAAEG